MENTIEQIKSLVNTLNIQNTPLMEKPSDYELEFLRNDISKGEYLKRDIPKCGNPDWLCYPEGVEEKIEDNKTYKVWLNWFNDINGDINIDDTWRKIKYIEEVPDDKISLIKYLEKLLKELK